MSAETTPGDLLPPPALDPGVRPGPAAVPGAIARVEHLVDPALRRAVDQLADERMRLIAGYQLGWWDVDGRPTAGHAGKAIRPTLAVLSAEAAPAIPGSGYRRRSPSSWCTTSRCCTTTSWIATWSAATDRPGGWCSARGRRSWPATPC